MAKNYTGDKTVENKEEKAILSKSTFIRGMQCAKSLYLHKKRPFLRDKLSAEQLAKFSRGTSVGVYARELFPGGVNAEPKTHFQMAASAIKTAEFIAAGETIIYEAAFKYNGVIIALDILVKHEQGWKAIEVKSSPGVSDTYIMDAALQYYVISGNGIKINDFCIAHIDGDYERQGDTEPSSLFRLQSVFEQVKAKRNFIEQKVNELKEVVNLKSSPPDALGMQCTDPYPCDFTGHCWKKIPDNSVFQLKGLSDEKKFEFFNNGIVNAIDIPGDSLEENKSLSLQVRSILENKIIADKQKLNEFFGKVNEPIVFFSMLWHQPAIPPFDGVGPYWRLPFSLAANRPGEKDNTGFCKMVPPGALMQYDILSELIEYLGKQGSIIVFEANHHLEILKKSLKSHPSLERSIADIESRIIDLQIPFNDYSLVWPQMQNSKTPQEILKSICNAKLASSLESANVYQKLMVSCNKASIDEGGQAIEKYHRDSLSGLIHLWEILKENYQISG